MVVLVLPNIGVNPPQVYMCSPSKKKKKLNLMLIKLLFNFTRVNENRSITCPMSQKLAQLEGVAYQLG